METITKKIGNAVFEFSPKYRETRSGFAHDCTLTMNGKEIAAESVHYLNRTWESYRFQTVMLKCVRKAIEQAKKQIVNNEKEKRGLKRLTQAHKSEIAKIIEEQNAMRILRLLEQEVSIAKYGTESEREELRNLDCMLAILQILKGAA